MPPYFRMPLSPRWLVLTAGLFMTGCAAPDGTKQNEGRLVAGRTSFRSGGRLIQVETFMPSGNGRHPGVLVLYGSGGAVAGKGEMTAFARRLSERGMAAFVVHYFNRTGTLAAGDGAIHKHWRTWEATIKDSVDFVAGHPRVRPEALGMFGYSLGAYLAIAESTRDARIKAVAELAGGIFDERQGLAQRFPPMLVLHGSADERVPVERVQTIQKEAWRLGVAPEVKIYDQEGHGLSPAAAEDASGRALSFLRKHLNPRD